jgi:hypothetical protein
MASPRPITSQYVIDMIERSAGSFDIAKYPTNELLDFNKNDIVRCSYLNKSLYRVLGYYMGKVTITKIDLNDDIYHISPQYLIKQKVNKDAVRVLFDGN